MLQLIIGTDWTVNRDRILNMIAENVRMRRAGQILLVPELISHDMERRLCEAAGDTASRYAEVLSFTRLSRRVNDSAHYPAMNCLDGGGRVVAMAAACRSLHSRLKVYASVETDPEFLTGLVDAVDEFKRCCIGPEDLRAAAERSEGSFAQKLTELSLILETYDALCAQGKRDPRDQETQLLERLEDCDFASSHVFYIDGFPDFTRQHLAILEHLIRESPQVVVSVNCDQVSSDAMAFEKAGQTAAEIIRLARHAGVEVEILHLNHRGGPLQSMCGSLFQGELPQMEAEVQVYRAESVFQECEEAARQIRELVENGARYREFSVVCGDLAAYADIARMVFRRHNIPLYQSGTEDILQKSVISSVLCAVDVVLGGFEPRDMLRYLKNVLSPLDEQTADRVENYAILWGIRGKDWTKPWKNHPEGLGENWSAGSEERLKRLEEARQTLVTPLIHMAEGFHKANTVAQRVDALSTYLEETQYASRLDRLAYKLDLAGDNRSAQILNQLWDILLDALEQLHGVLGDIHWDNQVFSRLLTLLLSQYDVGTIPPVLDAVMIGSVSAMRCQNPKHLLVLGAEEGMLPGYGGAQGVLTDQERLELRSLGVPLTGGSLDGLQAEFAEIYGVFCGARESVRVFSSSDQPSFVCQRLARMSGGFRSCRDHEPADALEAGAYFTRIGSKEAAEETGVLAEFQEIRAAGGHTLGHMSREQINGLYGTNLTLSASQVDRVAECRMSYFLKYGLRARERKEATIDPAEYGTFVHYVLEHGAREVMERGGFHRVSLKDTLEIARKYSDQYATEHFGQLDSQRTAYLFRRNMGELETVVRELWQELHISGFEPVDFETAFGGDGSLPAISIPNADMEAVLRGFVDRVDAWKSEGRNYFRVVDYKTGRKDFDYCDVFNGIGLQMLLYLFALEEGAEALLGENPKSAGVQYFPARVPMITADGKVTDEEAEALRAKEWKRKGLLLADDDVLHAMEPQDGPGRLCALWKKDGTLTGDVADREQLKLLKTYVMHCLRMLVNDIASGKVEPNPYTRGTSHDACAYCPYDMICHKAQVDGRRNYKAMTAQRFWEEIQKEVDRHG